MCIGILVHHKHKMGEQVFGAFALGLDNTSWVIVAEFWLYTNFGVNKFLAPLPGIERIL